MKSIKLSSDIKELYKVNEFIKDVILKEDLQVDLIVEEVFANIVNYSNTEFIKINAHYDDSTLTIEFIDNGIEFNPALNEDFEMPESIEETKIGGLGIHLTKELADDMEYKRKNNENHLRITKKVE